MYHSNISRYLSQNVNVFDKIIEDIEYEFNKPVRDIQAMKDRANKKKKGDIWEFFCKDWLLASGKYLRVWFLDEFNTEFPNAFVSKQDNGIDLIGQTNQEWHAIQCKYRSKKGRVDWKSLSTFLALCERSGPWNKYIVMTNCSGVTRKLPRTPKDKSICLKSFQNTSRDHWLRMIGKSDSAQILGSDSAQILGSDSNISPLKLVKPSSHTSKPSLQELRELRLQRFSQ